MAKKARKTTKTAAPGRRYVFKEPLTIKKGAEADPQALGESIAQALEANNGHLTPRAYRDLARNPRHPAHKHIEWDPEVAADKYQIDQAREIIRCVRIVSVERPNDEPTPVFLSIADKGGTAYRDVGEVMNSAKLQGMVMEQAERDLKAFEKRYRQFEEVCDLVRQARYRLRRSGDDNETRPLM